MKDFYKVQSPFMSWTLESLAKTYKVSLVEAAEMRRQALSEKCYSNGEYLVSVSEPHILPNWPSVIHLTIARADHQPVHRWADLQEIKNVLVGEEHEAIEVFPAESRLVDMGNQYHLWVFSSSGVRLPVGWNKRMVFKEMHDVSVD